MVNRAKNKEFALKFKPKRFPMTMAAIEQKEWGWAILAGAAELAVATDEANRGVESYCCGNRKCNAAIVVRSGKIPRVCSNCGGEIDWVGIKTRIIKVCPTCNYQGGSWEKFCPWDTPAVALLDKEIPI